MRERKGREMLQAIQASRREAERCGEFARLRAKSRSMRARIVEAQAEYEAGRITLSQELALFRRIEREMAAIGERMDDLASERPYFLPRMPR